MKLYILIIFIKVNYISCECDTYTKCINTFFNSFFKSVNYFEPKDIKSDESDFVDFGKENINKILSGVSSFLEDELRGTLDLDSQYQTFNKSNRTTIFVKTFIIDYSRNESDANDERDNITNILRTNTNVTSINDYLTPVTTEISNTIDIDDDKKRKQKTVSEKSIHKHLLPDIDYYTEDNATDYPIIDYVDLYKDTTNEFIGLVTEPHITINTSHAANLITDNGNKTRSYYTDNCQLGTSDDVTRVFSWIATIFVKNGSDQFQYYCDGAIISRNVIITAARCVNSTRPEDIVVILGKTSLQDMSENEKMMKVSEIIVHENFTDTKNDIALLKVEDVIQTTNFISIACMSEKDDFTDAVTTGWPATGGLTAINFVKDESQLCSTPEDLCGVYENNIQFCPSFGGLYAVKQDGWYLRGIRNADPTDREFCIHKPIHYTPLNRYAEWINDNV